MSFWLPYIFVLTSFAGVIVVLTSFEGVEGDCTGEARYNAPYQPSFNGTARFYIHTCIFTRIYIYI
jgi:hypothetical protein